MNELTTSIAVTSLVASGVFNSIGGIATLFKGGSPIVGVLIPIAGFCALVGLVSALVTVILNH